MDTVTDIPKLPPRKTESHKGNFGSVCIVGGKVGMSGAPALAAMSALKSGSGLVRVAIPSGILNIVASFDPCYITAPLTENENGEISETAVGTVVNLCKDSDIVAVGPGMGAGRGSRRLVNNLLKTDGLRIVADADALNCLAKETGWHKRKKASVIITPHPGELKRLWKSVFRDPMPSERKTQAAKFASETGCTVVLKGASTVVSDSQKVYVNTTGNPGMATGGSGDVLTGIIAALAGQGLSDFDASQLGVYIHGLSSDIAAEKYGQISLTPREIIKNLPKAFMRFV